MKQFLNVFNEMIGEKMRSNHVSDETIHKLVLEFHNMTDREQDACLQILYETLQNYDLIVYFMSLLLEYVQDRKILHYLQEPLKNQKYSLWDRLNDLKYLHVRLFHYPHLNDEAKDYQNFQSVYKRILDDIRLEMKNHYPWIPYEERKKKIVLVVSQLVLSKHAPTKITRYLYDSYMHMGYDVECFVCYLKMAGGVLVCKD